MRNIVKHCTILRLWIHCFIVFQGRCRFFSRKYDVVMNWETFLILSFFGITLDIFFLWGDKNNTAIFFLRSGQCFDSFFVNKCWIKIPQASDLSCTVDISEKKLCIHSIYHWIKTGNCLIIFSNHGTMIELCRQTGCIFNSVNLFRFMNQDDRLVYKLK